MAPTRPGAGGAAARRPSCGRAPGWGGSGSGPADHSAGRLRRLAVLPGTARDQDVRSVWATVLSGSVTNARGLTSAGHGDATLTVTAASAPATILLDYGVEVEGAQFLDVESYTGTAPVMSLAFTEARTYLRTPGSSTLAAAAAAGATIISVQPMP